MSMRTKLPCARAASTMRANCARQNAGSSFRPRAVSLTETFESSRRAAISASGLLVVARRLLALLAPRDVLAEHVERRHAALGVQTRDECHAPARGSRPRRSARRIASRSAWGRAGACGRSPRSGLSCRLRRVGAGGARKAPHVDAPRSRLGQPPRALARGRARGRHVVDEENARGRASGGPEGPAHVRRCARRAEGGSAPRSRGA